MIFQWENDYNLFDVIFLSGAAPRTDLLFKVLKMLTGNKENLCDFGLTEKQYLMNLYSLIALAEIKGYMMVQFSYIVFKMYGHDSLTLESDVSRRKFSTNTAYKISFAKEILNAASSDLWHCDSQNPEEGVSYVRLTKLLQGKCCLNRFCRFQHFNYLFQLAL